MTGREQPVSPGQEMALNPNSLRVDSEQVVDRVTRLLRKNSSKSFDSRAGQRVLRLDTKIMIHKREKLIACTSSKLKIFVPQKTQASEGKDKLQTECGKGGLPTTCPAKD